MLSLMNGDATTELVESLGTLSDAERVLVLRKLLGEGPCRQLGIYPIPEGFKLSVVIPVYNEERWITEVVRRVQAVPIPKEIVIVEDCSTDTTREVLKTLTDDNVRIVYQPHNQGKGAALRDGFALAGGDIILVQDADLEYDPREYPRLLQPILDDVADVVYGSRFLGGPHRVLYYWHYLANMGLTQLSNAISNINLTDMETCYKVFRAPIIKGMILESDRFGFEPEVTIKVARQGCRIYEVPISYYGRTYEEGKKIGWKDGVQALTTILRFGVMDRLLGRPTTRNTKDV